MSESSCVKNETTDIEWWQKMVAETSVEPIQI